MDQERALTTRNGYDDDLAEAGAVADAYAQRQAFTSYQQRQPTNTRRRQLADLRLFCAYLAESGVQWMAETMYQDPQAWRGVTGGLVEGLLAWQLQQGYAIGSFNIRLSTVKVYCKLATRAGVLDAQTLNMIRLVQGYRQKEGRNLDCEREQSRVGAKKAEPTAMHAGHAFLLCLLLDHGFRCGEVRLLPMSAVDLVAGTITVDREKVDLEQLHRLTADALLAAMAYLPDVADQQYLFPGRRNSHTGKVGPMDQRSIHDRIRTLGRRIGLPALSPHDLRHYWATVAMRNKTSVDRLQEAGGWSSPVMPLRYANKDKVANEGVNLG